MKIREILEEVEVLSATGDMEREIRALAFDSRKVGQGDMFFAVEGGTSDGHDYIASAVERGAAAVVCQKLPAEQAAGVIYIKVYDSNVALGLAADAFYGHPSRNLKLVGVTGTNGKTTTATLLYNLFRALGYEAGLISTVRYCVGGSCTESTHTTPDALRLNAMMAEMTACGCEYCFMEVSSHSIVQHRIEGLTFAGAIFTNITHDHLDYHKAFAEYIRAKKLFFDSLPAGAFALVNIDDKNGRVMVQNTRAEVKTLSMSTMADFRGRVTEMRMDGMLLALDGRELWVRFLGRFNASNLLGVYGAARLLGADTEEVLTAMSGLGAVDGRFEYMVSPGGVTAIVDYAHTPDALQNVIGTINDILPPEQKLITVVGCGGNRDATKRPVMAHIAASQSDMAILTSDNPRFEEPEEIIAQMKAGLAPGDRSLAIVDRREAIRTAIALARRGDVVLVAGKGHENYQDVKGVKHHFDDKEEIAKAVKQ
ncbi:MAG: UDP-N-acetylmuramoyl-L-alanyl-D-glutamate--2,6-diaminopimelate ligase [Rikenellaceae bacterium]|jgi:UDP-N-acetylmuramoyl-L-alanyl-D-glutamate--2,6-diaminopimelate ligase|nr:UDP-N-acetylmuramoyl-L-alanyl-D-glutamate--2,6-diaminopimelate ligase [Rikenellaceae bacterium]